MLHIFIIRASGSDLDEETFEIQDSDVIRAGARASARVADTFALASPAMRQRARAEYVATFASRRALEKTEESGVVLKPGLAKTRGAA